MRVEIVPVDTASEQKAIFGIVSIRQCLYLLGGLAIGYNLLGVFDLPYFSIGIRLVIYTILTAPIAVIVMLFGFFKVEKYDMYRDQYYINKIRYLMKRKSNRFRHGR